PASERQSLEVLLQSPVIHVLLSPDRTCHMRLHLRRYRRTSSRVAAYASPFIEFADDKRTATGGPNGLQIEERIFECWWLNGVCKSTECQNVNGLPRQRYTASTGGCSVCQTTPWCYGRSWAVPRRQTTESV